MYTQAQLMADIMQLLQDTMPNVITVIIFLAAVNFAFNLAIWAINYLVNSPFKKGY